MFLWVHAMKPTVLTVYGPVIACHSFENIFSYFFLWLRMFWEYFFFVWLRTYFENVFFNQPYSISNFFFFVPKKKVHWSFVLRSSFGMQNRENVLIFCFPFKFPLSNQNMHWCYDLISVFSTHSPFFLFRFRANIWIWQWTRRLCHSPA